MTSSPMLPAALQYYALGLSLIPTAPNSKRSAVPWKRFQDHRADESQVREWFGNGDGYGIAAVLGRASGGVCCRDFDMQPSYERWAAGHVALAGALPTVETARGRHVYCRADYRAFVDLEDGEYRGDGHYCLLPPSRHPTGAVYRWVIPLPASPIPLIDAQSAGLLACYTEYTENTEHPEIVSTVSSVSSVLHRLPDTLPERVKEIIRGCLPTGPGRRHRHVFDLARAIKAVPALSAMEVDDLRAIVKEWHRLALPYIETKDFTETWIDFIKGWPQVKIPKGATMQSVMQKALEVPMPKVAERYDSEPVRRLVALCRQLSLTAGDGSFFLSCRVAGELLEVSHVQANRWLFLLAHDKIIEQVDQGDRGKRQAFGYRYLGD